MSDQVKQIVAAFAKRLDGRDWTGLADLLHPDVVYELPQTHERIRGRDRYITFNQEYPGEWQIDPVLILGDERDGSLLFRWEVGDAAGGQLSIAYFEVDDGLITKITDFWPEPYEPPPGREHLTERW